MLEEGAVERDAAGKDAAVGERDGAREERLQRLVELGVDGEKSCGRVFGAEDVADEGVRDKLCRQDREALGARDEELGTVIGFGEYSVRCFLDLGREKTRGGEGGEEGRDRDFCSNKPGLVRVGQQLRLIRTDGEKHRKSARICLKRSVCRPRRRNDICEVTMLEQRRLVVDYRRNERTDRIERCDRGSRVCRRVGASCPAGHCRASDISMEGEKERRRANRRKSDPNRRSP